MFPNDAYDNRINDYDRRIRKAETDYTLRRDPRYQPRSPRMGQLYVQFAILFVGMALTMLIAYL